MLRLVLVVVAVLFALAIVQVIVSALRDRRGWPRKPHLGHWQKWDDDED